MLFSASGGWSQVIDVNKQNQEEDRRGSSIIDDSTKQVFGPQDTRYTYEKYLKYNNLEIFTIDTLIRNFHRFHYVPASGFMYQDLGNIGTALNPIFPENANEIGKMTGFTAYDPYYKTPDDIKYYNTLSPFSRFKIIWGGGGRALTEANYTRNINERINFGFEYRGYFIDKQINRQGRGDRNVQGVYYHLHGSYVSQNRKYVALAYFNRNRHVASDYGGIQSTTNDPMDDIFFSDNRQVNLTDAQTSDLRTNYHLYHQYELSRLVQVYHSVDRYKQLNRFSDSPVDDAFWPIDVVDSVQDYDRTKFNVLKNEFGVKGDVGKTFYNFYYKARKLNQNYKYLDSDTLSVPTNDLEHFGGVNLRFGNDSLSYIEAYGEVETRGNYLIGGRLQNTWFHAEARSQRTAPTYMQQAYRGSHHEWSNDFESSITTSISGGVSLSNSWLQFQPSAGYSLLTNYINFRQYYNADSLLLVAPFQAAGDISVLYAELAFSITLWKRLLLSSTTRFTNVSGSSADAIQVPELFHLSQLSYNNILFDGNLEIQVGFDFLWRSDYYAMGYDPAIMQYYVQDQFEVYSYPLIDVFINAKVNRGRWFLKLNNVTELIRGKGYFATPYYPGQATVLDFGIDWIFFD
ncbi:putative porin [Fulvivirga sedimenti]|uniref:Porin n=1 Tax=Fulvivirga sedimenti TaxID=2879465 RepID=A0A9X1KV13_9BACT|nr:putative porin [Fulvivirga sedimenti]MCA6073295.1 putative porin [Fulvivirga sedimenti]